MNVAKARYETFLEFLKTKKINLSNHELNKSAHSIKNLVSSSDVAAASSSPAALASRKMSGRRTRRTHATATTTRAAPDRAPTRTRPRRGCSSSGLPATGRVPQAAVPAAGPWLPWALLLGLTGATLSSQNMFKSMEICAKVITCHSKSYKALVF